MRAIAIIPLCVCLLSSAFAKPPLLLNYQDGDGQYNFGYSDPLSMRTESRTVDGVTRGAYSYYDQNGAIQTTEYEAGKDIGFRVKATNLPEAPLPVDETPEVKNARDKHLQLLEEANRREAEEKINSPQVKEANSVPAIAEAKLARDSQDKEVSSSQIIPITDIRSQSISETEIIPGAPLDNDQKSAKTSEPTSQTIPALPIQKQIQEQAASLPTQPLLSEAPAPASQTAQPIVQKQQEISTKGLPNQGPLIEPNILPEQRAFAAQNPFLLPFLGQGFSFESTLPQQRGLSPQHAQEKITAENINSELHVAPAQSRTSEQPAIPKQSTLPAQRGFPAPGIQGHSGSQIQNIFSDPAFLNQNGSPSGISTEQFTFPFPGSPDRSIAPKQTPLSEQRAFPTQNEVLGQQRLSSQGAFPQQQLEFHTPNGFSGQQRFPTQDALLQQRTAPTQTVLPRQQEFPTPNSRAGQSDLFREHAYPEQRTVLAQGGLANSQVFPSASGFFEQRFLEQNPLLRQQGFFAQPSFSEQQTIPRQNVNIEQQHGTPSQSADTTKQEISRQSTNFEQQMKQSDLAQPLVTPQPIIQRDNTATEQQVIPQQTGQQFIQQQNSIFEQQARQHAALIQQTIPQQSAISGQQFLPQGSIPDQQAIPRKNAGLEHQLIPQQSAIFGHQFLPQQGSIPQQQAISRQNAGLEQQSIPQQISGQQFLPQGSVPDQQAIRRQNSGLERQLISQQSAIFGHQFFPQQGSIPQQQAISRQNAGLEQQSISQQSAISGQQFLPQGSVPNQQAIPRQNSGLEQQLIPQQSAIFGHQFFAQQGSIPQQQAISRQNGGLEQQSIPQQSEISGQQFIEQQGSIVEQQAILRENAVPEQQIVPQKNEVPEQSSQRGSISEQQIAQRQNVGSEQKQITQQSAIPGHQAISQQNFILDQQAIARQIGFPEQQVLLGQRSAITEQQVGAIFNQKGEINNQGALSRQSSAEQQNSAAQIQTAAPELRGAAPQNLTPGQDSHPKESDHRSFPEELDQAHLQAQPSNLAAVAVPEPMRLVPATLPESVTYTPEVMAARQAHFRAYEIAARLAEESDRNPQILEQLLRGPAANNFQIAQKEIQRDNEGALRSGVSASTAPIIEDLRTQSAEETPGKLPEILPETAKAPEQRIETSIGESAQAVEARKIDSAQKLQPFNLPSVIEQPKLRTGLTPASTSLRVMDTRLPSLNEFQQSKLKEALALTCDTSLKVTEDKETKEKIDRHLVIVKPVEIAPIATQKDSSMPPRPVQKNWAFQYTYL